MKNRHERLGEYIIERCYTKEKTMKKTKEHKNLGDSYFQSQLELEALVEKDMAAERKDKAYQKYVESRSNRRAK